jgi:hypothetical protein
MPVPSTSPRTPAQIGLAEPGAAALEAARQDEDQEVRAAAEQALVTVRRGPQSWN